MTLELNETAGKKRKPTAFERAAVVVVGVMVLFSLGWQFGCWTATAIEEVYADGRLPFRLDLGLATGGGLALLLTFGFRILDHLEDLASYVRTGSPALAKSGLRSFALLGTAWLVTTISLLAASRYPPPSPGATPAPLFLIDASLGEEEPGAPLAAFPILFGWASGAPEITVGVGVDGERLEQVETLGRALLACVGSQPEEAVEVQVRGFADVNEFQNQSKDQQAELNLKAAHLRAESVSLILRDLEDEQGRHLTVLPKVQWSRIEEMLRFKLYLDRPFREAGGRDQGLFNRRAEVLIHATGACLPTERTPSRKRIQQAETGSKSTSAVRRVAGVGSR